MLIYKVKRVLEYYSLKMCGSLEIVKRKTLFGPLITVKASGEDVHALPELGLPYLFPFLIRWGLCQWIKGGASSQCFQEMHW